MVKGNIWLAKLDPIVGHEQAGTRPVLIISSNCLNKSGADMVIILPITTAKKNIATHVNISLKLNSYIICEQVRSISKKRLIKKLGTASEETMKQVKEIMLELIIK